MDKQHIIFGFSLVESIEILNEIGWINKWIPKKLKKGALHKSLNIPKGQKIPLQILLDKKRELQAQADGNQTLPDDKRKLLRRVNLALSFRKMKKKE
jgi:hypothetical protein